MIKSILHLAKMQLNVYNIYKSNFYLFTLNRVVEVVVYIFVWQALYEQTGITNGFSLEQMVTYYVLVVSLVSILNGGINELMSHSIRNGQMNKELLNPISYIKYYLGISIGEFVFAILVGLTTFTVCSILWSVALPISTINFLLFLLVILLGLPIIFFIQIIVGTVGFYTNSIWGMEILRRAIISIFSGLIAPLTFFPNWFQTLSNVLPFKELVYTPINIWLGKVSFNEILFAISKQIIWGIILYIIAKTFFNHAVKKVTINGG